MTYRTSIGLDVHARSISACALDHLTGELAQRTFPDPIPQDIIDWAAGFTGPARAVYESGPTGFSLARSLNASGLECVVGATSKMLRPSGDRVKNDKRDAVLLARMLSTGNIPEVRIPDPEQEAAKDLVRMREDARAELTAAKLRFSHFLLRKGHAYEKGKKTWTRKHMDWVRSLKFDTALDKEVFDELLAGVLAATDRRDRIQRLVEKEAQSERWSPMVARLSCMHLHLYRPRHRRRDRRLRQVPEREGLPILRRAFHERELHRRQSSHRRHHQDGQHACAKAAHRGVLALFEAEDAQPDHRCRGRSSRSGGARAKGLHSPQETCGSPQISGQEGMRRGHRDIAGASRLGVGSRDDVAVKSGGVLSRRGIRHPAICNPLGHARY